jgi:hypothetical protein
MGEACSSHELNIGMKNWYNIYSIFLKRRRYYKSYKPRIEDNIKMDAKQKFM